MTPIRQDLEQAIIGACILENGYSLVAGALSARNFTHSEPISHRTIFEAIEQLYPMRPVDLLTVTHKINKSGYASYLSECICKVCSSANLRYHAFALLQLSMRDALISTLDKAGAMPINTTTRAALKEIIDECLDSNNDILEIYPGALSYLNSVGVEETILVELRRLLQGIEQKVNTIRDCAHVESLINNLNQLAKSGSDLTSRLVLSRLTELAKEVLVKRSVSPTVLEALNRIKV